MSFFVNATLENKIAVNDYLLQYLCVVFIVSHGIVLRLLSVAGLVDFEIVCRISLMKQLKAFLYKWRVAVLFNTSYFVLVCNCSWSCMLGLGCLGRSIFMMAPSTIASHSGVNFKAVTSVRVVNCRCRILQVFLLKEVFVVFVTNITNV